MKRMIVTSIILVLLFGELQREATVANYATVQHAE